MKNKKTVLLIVASLALLVAVCCGVFVVISLVTGKSLGITLKSKEKVYKSCEETYKQEAMTYIDGKRVLYAYNQDIVLLTKDIGANCEPCNGYVIANIKDNKYDVYVKCNSYKTNGYDEKIYEDALNK